ncbi:MAG: DinB family protein [Firmicutes bacterium]|nr:DinB family protein [Bacillota bacterium]
MQRDLLESTRAELLAQIAGLSEEQLNWKPTPSSWSIAQVVEHIAMAEDSIARLIPIGLAQPPTYTERELGLDQSIPDRSTKLQAPARLDPSQVAMSPAQLVSLLIQCRARTIAILDSMTDSDSDRLSKTSPPHPHQLLGPMSTRQWIDAIPLHERRHIKQIVELKEGFPS